MTDSTSINEAIRDFKPTEVYNLAAQSHVGQSFQVPISTADITGVGCERILQAVQRFAPKAKFYQAGTSELFGGSAASGYSFNERDRFHPRSPYACAKAYAHYATVHAREAHGLFAVNGLLFNHESPFRGEEFVTRKITRAVGRIKAGTQAILKLGDLTPRRDWGFAGDYVRAMWMMLQQRDPDDYVVATGYSWSVADFANLAFEVAGLNAEDYVERDSSLLRPAEVWNLRGNSACIRALGWEPEVNFKGLVKLMVDHDVALAKTEPGPSMR